MRLFSKKPTLTAINLGLQGGGAHGAFTWGVLDALLEDGRLAFDGISGTSAGAMNAVALAQGLTDGGIDGARAALQRFWTAVAAAVPEGLTHAGDDGSVVLSPVARLMMHWAQYLTPEQINPFDLNPLRDVIEAQIDFERLRARSPVKLFIATTEANTGKLRLFRNRDLHCEALLASACLPTVHRTVMIDGQPYWDGGYSANPAVFPLFFECKARDNLLVLLTPLRHRDTPVSAQDIQDRVMQIGFSSTFLREMRMYAHLREHLPRNWLGLQTGTIERSVRQTRFHIIEAAEVLGALNAETKLAANLRFFERLRDHGRAHGRQWLQRHRGDVGRRSTVDVDELFY